MALGDVCADEGIPELIDFKIFFYRASVDLIVRTQYKKLILYTATH
jgi:hypothetical protein